MAKLQLSDRERWAMFVHLNGLPVQGRSEHRKVDRLWTTLSLDAIAMACEAKREGVRATDWDHEVRTEFELTSDQRDYLIDALEKPMGSGLSRILFPIEELLVKSRDGDT